MALKALMLKKELDNKRKAFNLLLEKDKEFEARDAELQTVISELSDAATEEEMATVNEEVEKFESERSEHKKNKTELEDEIRELETELDELEEKQADPEPEPEKAPEERKDMRKMETRKFFGMTAVERDQFFAREDVQHFLGEIRSCIREKRALENVGLTVPTVMLGLIRENILEYSKLYKHVNVRVVNGEGRAVIMGTIPEAVWTDCCANLNELDLSFNDVEINCWRVGGYFAICNANLEDSDIDLAVELLTTLGQAIGYALDKAIVFGTGVRMPLGIVTRLVQENQPQDYPATARPWVDLHTTNVKVIPAEVEGIDLFKAIALDSGAAKGAYSRGGKVWIMNETTYTQIVANAMEVDGAGAIVSGVNGTMPVIGGIIEVLNFMPDDVIVGGYGDLYLLAERAGQRFATSEHVRFLQDQTVFRGTGRYDGQPAIAEGFVALGLNGTKPDANVPFAPDDANADPESE